MLPFFKVHLFHLAIIQRQLRKIVYVPQLHLRCLIPLEDRVLPRHVTDCLFVVVFHIVYQHLSNQREDVLLHNLGGVLVV